MADIGKPQIPKGDLMNAVFRAKCTEDKIEDIKRMLKEDDRGELDLDRAVLATCFHGSLTVLKHFLETPNLREKINLYTPYEAGPPHYIPDGLLLHSYFKGHPHVVDYFLYDIKFDVCRDTKNYLEFHNETELLNKIEKRDLFFLMNKEIQDNSQESKEKKPKL